MTPSKSNLQSGENIQLYLSIFNDEAHTVSLLKWSVPGSSDDATYFDVLRDGERVIYLGKLYKRPAPTAGDFINIAPGEQITRLVNLAKQFDFSATGNYQIKYKPVMRHQYTGILKKQTRTPSATTSIWVDGVDRSTVLDDIKRQVQMEKLLSVRGANPANNCSRSRKNIIRRAFNASRDLARNSRNYLAADDLRARYRTWFGAAVDWRKNRVLNNFRKIINTQNSRNVQFDCSCSISYYA